MDSEGVMRPDSFVGSSTAVLLPYFHPLFSLCWKLAVKAMLVHMLAPRPIRALGW